MTPKKLHKKKGRERNIKPMLKDYIGIRHHWMIAENVYVWLAGSGTLCLNVKGATTNLFTYLIYWQVTTIVVSLIVSVEVILSE